MFNSSNKMINIDTSKVIKKVSMRIVGNRFKGLRFIDEKDNYIVDTDFKTNKYTDRF